MIRATSIIRRDAVDADCIVDIITLDHGDRHRRRILLKADGGTAFLLDLDKGSDLMLHESANGQLSFNTRTSGGSWSNTWTSLDLDATLEAFLKAEA